MATSNPSVFMAMPFILLLSIINNVKSDSFSFTFPSFEQDTRNIGLLDGTTISGSAIQLTKKDKQGKPLKHDVGLAGFLTEVRLYDKNRGRFDFTTDFSFVVNRRGFELHGDGMTFFLASTDFDFPNDNSTGGFLGLFTPQTAFSAPGKNKIVAVEFDSFANEWDPNGVSGSPHVGIDLGSISSMATTSWPCDVEADGEIARAIISYDSESLEFSVSVRYPNSKRPGSGVTVLKSEIDLTEVLQEKVLIGFTAATGELVETHDILSWDYNSST